MSTLLAMLLFLVGAFIIYAVGYHVGARRERERRDG